MNFHSKIKFFLSDFTTFIFFLQKNVFFFKIGVIFFVFSIFGSILLNILSRKHQFLWFTPPLILSLIILGLFQIEQSDFQAIIVILFASFQLSIGSLVFIVPIENLPDVVVVILIFFHWIGDLIISITMNLLIHSQKMIGVLYFVLAGFSFLIYLLVWKFIYNTEKEDSSVVFNNEEETNNKSKEEEKGL